MTEDFKIIVFTSPGHVVSEPEKIIRLLDCGVDIVHVRKPDSGYDEMRNLIESIPDRLHDRLRIHGHFSLAGEFNLAGVHINSRCPKAPESVKSVSKSCHSIEELSETVGFDYVTLSPIFDSISKSGYASRFDLETIKDSICGRHVVALGGVTPESFLGLRKKGFYGAALLGYIWSSDFESALQGLKQGIRRLRSSERDSDTI